MVKAKEDRQTLRRVMARLRERREALGLSQAALAETIDVAASYIGLRERGERVPSLDTLLALCRAVELAPAELFADASPTRLAEIPELAQLRGMIDAWPNEHRRALVRVAKEFDRVRQR